MIVNYVSGIAPEIMPKDPAVSATKCPHFDVSKPNCLETFIACHKNNKLYELLNGLKPSSKSAICSKLTGCTVKQHERDYKPKQYIFNFYFIAGKSSV